MSKEMRKQINLIKNSLLNENFNENDYKNLLEKIENILITVSNKENVSFEIENIYLYGGMVKKGFDNTKDIDLFVEVSDFESNSDKIDDDTTDFKDFLHEIPESEYGHDFMYFKGKFLDINLTDYEFELDFEDEPKIDLYKYK